MKRRLGFLLSGLILALVLLFSLSRLPLAAQEEFSAEVWVEGNGSGRGALSLYLPPELGISIDDLVSELRSEPTVQVTSVREKGDSVYEISISWANFPDAFAPDGSMETNRDGSISLNFGNVSNFDHFIVHVQGKVQETTGQKKGADTVVFQGVSEATLTFTPLGKTLPPTESATPPPSETAFPTPTGGTPSPTSSSPLVLPTAPGETGAGTSSGFPLWAIIVIAFGALFILALILLIVSLNARKKGQAMPRAALSCPQCGRLLTAGARFCPHCGSVSGPTSIQAGEKCPQCGAQAAPGTKFCPKCGSSMIAAPPSPPPPPPPPTEEVCSQCGAKLTPESKFCPNCGSAKKTEG